MSVLASLIVTTSAIATQYPWEKKESDTAGQQAPRAITEQKKSRLVTVGAFTFKTKYTVINHDDPDLGEMTVLVDDVGTPMAALQFDQEPFADAVPLDEAQSKLVKHITHQKVEQIRIGKNDVLLFIDSQGDSIHQAFVNLGASLYNILITYNGSVDHLTKEVEEVLSTLSVSN